MNNRIIYAEDCLNVLNDEVALPTESVDLIYLDPPFNSKSNYNLPFKDRLKRDLKPVEAFTDTWTWGNNEEEYLDELSKGPLTKEIANIIKITKSIDYGGGGASLSAYLINMSMRLIPMRRVLKETGSIYLHCDPTASHYLKLVMDTIFGSKQFKNEIIWSYRTGGVSKKWWPKKHDVILFYWKQDKYIHNPPKERIYYERPFFTSNVDEEGRHYADVYIRDVWDDVKPIINTAKERLGYPTQKPIKLIERIVQASSNEGDLVLDPFCGCGTTIHAAEKLKRNWIGIDISTFSVGLMRERILSNFYYLVQEDIKIFGTPIDLQSARELAQKPFEFEKWVCGEIGAHGMFHNPGERGADRGVDGVLNFATFEELGKLNTEYAIIQVKGGRVTADSVRALSHTIEQFEAKAGILVCFEEYMNTVENNRKKDTYSDATGTYPVIQGLSVEDLLNKKKPKLPPLIFREDARLQRDILKMRQKRHPSIWPE